MTITLIPKGHNTQICKNDHQRSVVGGEVSVTALANPEEQTIVLLIEDHLKETTKITAALYLRELEVLKDVINDVLWKAKVK